MSLPLEMHEEVNWRDYLRRLVNIPRDADFFPFVLYTADAPSEVKLDTLELPPLSDTLRNFYELCDGGYLADHLWYRVADLPAKLRWWLGLDETNHRQLHPARHVILAEDSAGFPLAWDSINDQVFHYYYRSDEGLSPLGMSLEEFLNWLFSPEAGVEEWKQCLDALLVGITEVAPSASEGDRRE